MKLNKETISQYPTRRFFIRYAIPGMVGTLMANIAALVDGIFVANFVSPEAFAAISVVWPIISVTLGIFIMLTIGATAIAGKYIGENKRIRANLIFTQTILVVFVLAVILLFFIYMLKDIVLPILGAHGEILKYANIYFLPLVVSSFFTGMAYCMGQFVRLDGSPRYTSSAFIVAAITNIILDALFIIVFKWGIAGAGWATAIGQFVALAMMLLHFRRKKCSLKIIKIYGGWIYIVRAAMNGFSEFISSASGGLIAWLFNITAFAIMGNMGVIAFSVVNYAIFFMTMLVYALGESIQPLISVAFGAKNRKKMESFLHTALMIGILISFILMSIVIVNPALFVDRLLKNIDIETYNTAIFFLRTMSMAFVGISLNICMSAYYTSVQCAGASAIIAFLRGTALPTILILTLPKIFDVWGLVLVLPLSEIITLIVSISLYRKRRPKILVPY